jgi:hypothetical protein
MIFDKYIILYPKTMRIFVANIELNQLFSQMQSQTKYLIQSKKQWEIYSKEGMFVVDHSDLYQLHISNEKQEEFQHEGYSLLIDYSQVTREKVTRLPSDHIHHFIQYDTYALEPKSKVKLVLKTMEANNKRYPLDVYFEIEDSSVDPKSPWILDDILNLFQFFHL